MPEIKLDLR